MDLGIGWNRGALIVPLAAAALVVAAACSSSVAGGAAAVAPAAAATAAPVVGAGSYGGSADYGRAAAATAMPAAGGADYGSGSGGYGGKSYGAGAAASSAPAAAPGGGMAEVKTATDAKVGSFLTGANGMTLYIFTKDPKDTSVCSGSCATNWPPFTAAAGGSPKAGAGLAGTLATITRADGGTQVTYNGAPLYYFAADAKAGDVTGQGVGGVWFVATP